MISSSRTKSTRLKNTYDDWSHPLFEDERGEDFPEEAEEEAVLLFFLAFRQLRTAKDVESIRLLNTTDDAEIDERSSM